MTTEIMDCYVPEGEDVDFGPINIENYEGTLDAEELAAFEATMKIVEEANLKVNSVLN